MENTPYPNIRRASRALSLAFPDVDEEERQNQAYLVSVRRRTIQDAMAYLKRKSQDATPAAPTAAPASAAAAARATATASTTSATSKPSSTQTNAGAALPSTSNSTPRAQPGASTHLSESNTRRHAVPVATAPTSTAAMPVQATMSDHSVGAMTSSSPTAAALTIHTTKEKKSTPLTVQRSLADVSRSQLASSPNKTAPSAAATPMVHYLYGDKADNIEKEVLSQPGQVIVFTTSMTGERCVRDQSRALETLLYIKQIPYHYMDVADNACLQRLAREIYLAAMKKAALKQQREKEKEQQAGNHSGVVQNNSMTSTRSSSTVGSKSTHTTLSPSVRQQLRHTHLPLPLLCVNKHLIGTYTTVQELEDDGLLLEKLVAKGFRPKSQPPPPPPPERPAPLLDAQDKNTKKENNKNSNDTQEGKDALPPSSTPSDAHAAAEASRKVGNGEAKEVKAAAAVRTHDEDEAKPPMKSPTPPPSRSHRGFAAENTTRANAEQQQQQPRLGTQIDRHGSASHITPSHRTHHNHTAPLREQEEEGGGQANNNHSHAAQHTGAPVRDLASVSAAAALEKSATGMVPGTMINASLPFAEVNHKLSPDSSRTSSSRNEVNERLGGTAAAARAAIVQNNTRRSSAHNTPSHPSHPHNNNSNQPSTGANGTRALPSPPRQPVYTSEELMRPFAKHSVITDISSSSRPHTMTNSSMATQGKTPCAPCSPAHSPDNVLLRFSRTRSPSLPHYMNGLPHVKPSRRLSDGYAAHSHHLYT